MALNVAKSLQWEVGMKACSEWFYEKGEGGEKAIGKSTVPRPGVDRLCFLML